MPVRKNKGIKRYSLEKFARRAASNTCADAKNNPPMIDTSDAFFQLITGDENSSSNFSDFLLLNKEEEKTNPKPNNAPITKPKLVPTNRYSPAKFLTSDRLATPHLNTPSPNPAKRPLHNDALTTRL